jgi:hypothetical protein
VTAWLIGLIILPIALAETGELAPWLARRVLNWGAQRLGDQQTRERYGEEWCTDLERVPGKITKLGYAVTVVLLAVPRLRYRVWRSEREVPGMRAASMRALAALESTDDTDTLANLIAGGVVCSLGFSSVTVNLACGDNDLRCIAAIGPQEMKDELLGNTCPRETIERILTRGTVWGALRFIAHAADFNGAHGYVPTTAEAPLAEPDVWFPEFGLLAPLRAPDGELIGLLSLDCPANGRIPGPAQRAAIETYAAHTAARWFDVQNKHTSPPRPTALP